MDDEEAEEAPSGARGKLDASAGAVAGDANDNETTNCSETMSTANEEEWTSNEGNQCGQLSSALAMTREPSPCRIAPTRVSVKNRPATPRRHPAAAGGEENCDVNTLRTFVGRRNGCGPNQSVAGATASAQDDSTADTLSLATLSGVQAPPSYGTATASNRPAAGFTCTTLDASQLADTMSGMLATAPVNRIYYTLSNNHYAQNQTNRIAQPLLTSMGGKTIAANTMQHQQPQRQPSDLSGKRQMSSSAEPQEQSRLSSLPNKYVYASTATRMENDALSPSVPLQPVAGSSGGYLSSSMSNSRSLPRFQLAHLNGACGAKTGDDLRRQLATNEHPQRQFNLRLTTDNNQNAKSNLRQELGEFHLQAPRLQMFAEAGGPINHVISAEGSIQQHSANQYYAASRLSAPGAAEVLPAAALRPLIPSQSSKESACLASGRIMDAAAAHQQQVALKMQQQTLGWPPSTNQSTVPNRNQILRSINRDQEEIVGQLGAEEEFNEHAGQLRLGNEGLEATGSAPKLLQVQRRRRRHKSTSGRSVSPQSGRRTAASGWHPPEAGLKRATASSDYKVNHRRSLASLLSPTPISAGQSIQRSSERLTNVRSRPAISAHCWLVDSSDEQTYTASNNTKLMPREQKPLSDERDSTNCSTNALKSPEPGKHQQFVSTQHLTVAMMRQTQRRQQALHNYNENRINGPTSSLPRSINEPDQAHTNRMAAKSIYEQDLTTDLKTNSLKMEHILNKSGQAPSISNGSTALMDTSSFKLVQTKQRCRRASISPSETASENGAYVPASTIMRLSSLLSFASNLVKLAPKCLKSRHSCSAPPNSISGAVSTTSASGQLAAYTISSSSSTSAYATGSSSATTNNPANGRNQPRCSINMANEQPLLMASNFNQPSLKPSSAASTTGSSLFYSSSGTSGFQLATNSLSHGYEYCDTLPIDKYAITETQFNGEKGATRRQDQIDHQRDKRLCEHPMDGTSTTASSSSSSMSSRAQEVQAGQLADQEARRLAHLLMSDNELLSAGSDSANIDANAGFGLSALPAVVGSAAPSKARRRWWWISTKEWMRRPCSNGSDSGSGEQVGPCDQSADGARYKSLRSARIKQTSSNGTGRNYSSKIVNTGTSPSTLQNVISLAKADRVFRLRLIASLLVSVILLALICLLAGLIYIRSSAFYQRSKINLLIDESDYDLSWLWPTLLPQGGHLLLTGSAINGASKPPLNGQSSTGPAYKVMDYLQWRAGPDQLLEGSLRSQLGLIERSERLEQSQQIMTHLTNIQLANDYFIDITQLPELWNLSDTVSTLSANKTAGELPAPKGNSFDRMHQDLASLTLLSNLHWPLVKWRHQNQQSMANFLSFAMPSPRVSSASTQTIRSLLSLLMLTESLASNKPSQTMQNLQQFGRLNSLIQKTSKQLISCSLPTRMTNLRAKFCKQLITRYKRMMATLSNLNHNHLSKLHGSSNQFNQFEHTQEYSEADRQFKWPSSSRTLFGFFLDRLALLDVQLLADSIWAANYEETDLIVDLESETDQAQLIEQLISQNHDGSLASETEFDDNGNNKWLMPSYLLEFTKSVVGEGPVKLNVNMERNRNFQARFQKLESDNNQLWREQLHQDLLLPWPSFELPQFLEPLNYDLFLHPNLTTQLIMGMVKIEFQISRPSRYIVLNIDQLNIVDLSLWLKSPNDEIASKIEQSKSSPDSPNYTTNQPQGYTLKPIAIRRVLINNKLEQIYIELEDIIGPLAEHKGSSGSDENELKTDGLNFGELPKMQSPNQRDNHFVLSISFNKTSLMITEPLANHAISSEDGVEFTRHGDYFAQPEGEVKTILYTKFEPFNARKLFPSFDEPHLKARFQLNLVHENNHQVLFNTPKRERVPYTADGLLQMSVFESTPIPLSTYLVSFIVCDSQNIRSITSRVTQPPVGLARNRPLMSSFEPESTVDSQISSSKESRHIQVQILAQFEHLGQAEFASQLVPQLLTFYQTHLQLGYPLEKLDLMAIPKQLSHYRSASKEVSAKSGTNVDLQPQQLDTMENFGLIWFRAPLLLVDTNLISQNLIEQISKIISHQLAHQYFGNIVSIRRWQDLWLYESLCQYLEAIALSNVQADWKLDEQFLVTTIHETLTSEQFSSSGDQFEVANAMDQLAGDEAADAMESDGGLGQLEPGQDEFMGLEQVGSVKMQQQLGDWPNQLRPSELRKSSAVLHMLMFNLLPSNEAKARLLRRCLVVYQFKTMSRRRFWLQFGEQLAQAGSVERMPPNQSNMGALNEMLEAETGIHSQAAPMVNHEFLNHNVQQHPASGVNERVVFVKSIPQPVQKLDERTDVHRIRVRASTQANNRLMDNLELVANAWFERQGYPLITASVHRDLIILKQERFSYTWWDQNSSDDVLPLPNGREGLSPEASSDVQLEDVWPIPLMFVSRFNPKQARFVWMNKRKLEIPVDENSLSQSPGATDESHAAHLLTLLPRKSNHVSTWFKLNSNQSSLVRVNYDDRNWEALIELLMKPHYSNHLLSPLDRANLIDDAMTLMRCGKLSVGIAMNLTLYLEVGERDFMPWTSALKHLDQMQTLLNQNPLWHRYVLRLMQPISSVIGWKDDGPHLMRKLRRNLFSVSLQYGDDKMVSKAKQEFKAWFKSNRFIVPNLQDLVYVAGVRYGDQQEWFHCWQRYQQLAALEGEISNLTASSHNPLPPTNSRDKLSQSTLLAGVGPLAVGESIDNEASAENEKRQLLTALASTHNTWLLEQFLNYSLDSTKIQPHHLKHVMQTLGKNPVARLYLWRFVRLNWDTLADKHLERFHRESTTTGKQRATISSNHILETMIVESTKHFATKLDYEEVKAFSLGKKNQNQYWSPAIERAVQQSLQLIRSNIYWRDYVEPKLTNWLSHYDNLLSK